MIKNHPFQNGNKRIAIATLLLFLLQNRRWLQVDAQGFYNFTVWIAQSPAPAKEQVVEAIQNFVRRHLMDAV
jgi:prophage maintenance system killer protein